MNMLTAASEQTLENNIAYELDYAMSKGEIFLAYQPQIDSATGRLTGFESLVRWKHSSRGSIPPSVFIPLAEQSGKIVELGAWILDRACADLKKLHRVRGTDDLQMAVNLSSIQLGAPNIYRYVMDTLKKYELSPRHLHLELTETALIANCKQAIGIVRSLSRGGVEVWIDDFGTGFTSISMLREFPVSGIKIDRSFVKGICDGEDDGDFCLVSALIAMAHRMRLKVVAEGIETEDQLRVLQQLGCDRLQGFLIGKPVSLREVSRNWR